MVNSLITILDLLAEYGRLTLEENQSAEPGDLGGETGSATSETNDGRVSIVAQGERVES